MQVFPIIQHVSSPPKIAKIQAKTSEAKVAFLDKPSEGYYKYEEIEYEKKLAPTLNVSFSSSESNEEQRKNDKKTPTMSPQQNNFSAASSKADSEPFESTTQVFNFEKMIEEPKED